MSRTRSGGDPHRAAPFGRRRMGVAETKAKLSEVLRSLADGPVIIHARGRDIGALLDLETFERLAAGAGQSAAPGGAGFIAAVEELKRRYGGGVSGFDPKPAVIRASDPFGRSE